MVDTVYPVNAVTGAPSNTGRMLRQTGAVALAGATAVRPLGARSGVRPGTSTATVTATSTTWSCGPFAGAIDAESAAEAGPYLFAFDAAASGTLTAANASNPRIDIIYVQVDDPSESDGTSTPAVRRGYLAGVAAATPVAPAAPARSFVVAQINVPMSGGGAPTVTWVAPYVVAAGGILPIDTLANLNALVGAPGQHAVVYADATPANNGDYAWNGTIWVRRVAPFAQASGVVQSANVAGSSVPPLYWDGGTAINFPVGLFTVTPIVKVTLQDDPSGGVAWATAYSTTAAGTVARVLRAGGAPTASYKIGWTAVQATPTSAAG